MSGTILPISGWTSVRMHRYLQDTMCGTPDDEGIWLDANHFYAAVMLLDLEIKRSDEWEYFEYLWTNFYNGEGKEQ